MNEIIQKEEIVRIINDKLVIDAGTDWIAIFALCFSIISTIGILCWQNYLRKKDKEEQVKIRENDKKEERQRIAKENKVRKWNAEYPYKLKLFTEYYDTLYRFVNYKGSVKEILGNSGTQTFSYCRIRATDIMDMCSSLNKYTEEAKLLFSLSIQAEIKENYHKVESFFNDPVGQRKPLSEFTYILENEHTNQGIYTQICKNLETLQQRIKDSKLMDLSRDRFRQELKLEGNKDE